MERVIEANLGDRSARNRREEYPSKTRTNRMSEAWLERSNTESLPVVDLFAESLDLWSLNK
jgi:hypothetical protein